MLTRGRISCCGNVTRNVDKCTPPPGGAWGPGLGPLSSAAGMLRQAAGWGCAREGTGGGRAGGNRASLPSLLSHVALQTVVLEPHPVRGQLLESPFSVLVLSVLEA